MFFILGLLWIIYKRLKVDISVLLHKGKAVVALERYGVGSWDHNRFIGVPREGGQNGPAARFVHFYN